MLRHSSECLYLLRIQHGSLLCQQSSHSRLIFCTRSFCSVKTAATAFSKRCVGSAAVTLGRVGGPATSASSAFIRCPAFALRAPFSGNPAWIRDGAPFRKTASRSAAFVLRRPLTPVERATSKIAGRAAVTLRIEGSFVKRSKKENYGEYFSLVIKTI